LLERFQLLNDLEMDVLVRPDHAPTMFGENNDEPGYAALGRIFAIGYFKGILKAISKQQN
jgi:mannonate dehydratase